MYFSEEQYSYIELNSHYSDDGYDGEWTQLTKEEWEEKKRIEKVFEKPYRIVKKLLLFNTLLLTILISIHIVGAILS